MSCRKVWTPEQDRVLRLIYEERGMKKWADMPKIMQQEFNIEGRSAKQCRERYHNHLASNINNTEINEEQEDLIFELQKQMGNKWAQISSKLPGRTDSQIKNHFYSKLRKAVRKVNRLIIKHLRCQFKQIKTSALYHVIQAFQTRSKRSGHLEADTCQICKNIRDKLRAFEDTEFVDKQNQIENARQIAELFGTIDKQIVKNRTKNNSLNTSGRLLSEGLVNNIVSSTRSAHDQDSQSYSNSDIYSSSGYDVSFQSSQSIRKKSSKNFSGVDLPLSRSGSFYADDQKRDEAQFLHHSVNELAPRRSRSTRQLNKIGKDFMQNEGSDKDSSSKNSNRSKNQNQSYMFQQFKLTISGPRDIFQQFYTPKALTNQEKIQLMAEKTDEVFYGQMMLEEAQELTNKLGGISLIPELERTDKTKFD